MAIHPSRLQRWAIALAIVGISVVALGLGLVKVTESPALCAACHEMEPKVEAWRTSGHTKVGCPACHEQQRPWHQFPATLARRSGMLARDLRAHFSDTIKATPASTRERAVVSDSKCLGCHDLSRRISMRYGTLIDHAEHAKRNGSCVSCHLWTAHPDPEAEKPLLMMERCFTCHGTSPKAKAPGTCGTCHPASFSLSPQSHNSDGWRSEHGKAALTKRQPCSMCHEKDFCTSCHGLEMPHPQGWAKGKTGHAPVVAKVGRQACVQCHRESPDFCTMCHHEGYEPQRGPWIDQHPRSVSRRGASFCMDCHTPLYCVTCHTGGRLPVPPTAISKQ